MIPKYHRCASIPCTDCCGNSPTPTRTRPPPFSWLHFFSLYLFPTLYQWLEYLCGFLPSTVASSCRQLSQVWQRQFKTCSLFQEKPQPPKPRWDPTSSQTALLCPCKDTETPWFNVFSSACQGFTSYPPAPTTSLVLHFQHCCPSCQHICALIIIPKHNAGSFSSLTPNSMLSTAPTHLPPLLPRQLRQGWHCQDKLRCRAGALGSQSPIQQGQGAGAVLLRSSWVRLSPQPLPQPKCNTDLCRTCPE